MPGQSRLDAPGALHHVIARGIERRSVFLGPADYEDFLRRMGAVTEWGKWSVFAWALIPNHKKNRRVVVQARRAFSQVAVRRLGYAGAEVARYLGVTTSCVNRAAGKSEWDHLAKTVSEPSSPS